MNDSSEFQGKRVLVTGGTQGAGEAIARRLAGAGARVATAARSKPEGGAPGELQVLADWRPWLAPRRRRRRCWRPSAGWMCWSTMSVARRHRAVAFKRRRRSSGSRS